MSDSLNLTYPAIYHEDDDYIYIEVPDLGIDEFKIPVSERNQMVDITWEKGSQRLMQYILFNQPLPESKTLDDLEVFEGNDKDAFLLEYIRE